jgi:hypothetical protein
MRAEPEAGRMGGKALAIGLIPARSLPKFNIAETAA